MILKLPLMLATCIFLLFSCSGTDDSEVTKSFEKLSFGNEPFLQNKAYKIDDEECTESKDCVAIIFFYKTDNKTYRNMGVKSRTDDYKLIISSTDAGATFTINRIKNRITCRVDEGIAKETLFSDTSEDPAVIPETRKETYTFRQNVFTGTGGCEITFNENDFITGVVYKETDESR